MKILVFSLLPTVWPYLPTTWLRGWVTWPYLPTAWPRGRTVWLYLPTT